MIGWAGVCAGKREGYIMKGGCSNNYDFDLALYKSLLQHKHTHTHTHIYTYMHNSIHTK